MIDDTLLNAQPPRTILLVAPYVPPHLGGLEKYVFNLATQLVRRYGLRVIVAATSGGDVSVRETESLFAQVDGLEVRWLPAIGKISNTPVGFGWIRRLRKIIQQENVSLVNAHGPVPLVADIAAVAATNVPFVLTYHFGPMAKGRWSTDIVLWFYENVALPWTVNKSDAVVAVSEFVQRTLPRATSGRPAEIIHPAVDTDLFSPGAPAESVRALFVGTLTAATRHKGLSDLMEAVQLLHTDGHRIVLEVVGDGDDLPRYRREADLRGIKESVVFSGALQGECLVDAYRRSGVLAVPSRFDNFPTVAIEAMACGRPVIATNVGSVSDLVTDGVTGIIVSPGDAVAMAEALLRILSDDALASRMGMAARESAVSHFSLEVQAARTVKVYRDAVGRCGVEIFRLG